MRILITVIFFILQITASEFAVRELVFADATPTFLEKIIYHLVTAPPFIIALILISETKNLYKTFGYTSIFYVISIIVIQLFLKIPNSVDYPTGVSASMGSYGFFQTGGSFGGLSLFPQILVTAITTYLLYKQK